MDQPGLAGRHANPGQRGFGRLLAAPLKAVGPGAGDALLGLEGRHNRPRGLSPGRIERLGVAARLPVIMRQPQHIAQRIQLPLALRDPRFHLGPIGPRPIEPAGRGRIAGEGIGIGIDQHAARVPPDQPAIKPRQLRIAAHQMEVRPQLRRAVTQPQRSNIAGDDKGIVVAICGAHEHGRIKRIGETVLEQPGQFRVFDQRANPVNLTLHRLADKPAVADWRAVGGKHRRLLSSQRRR